MKNNFFFYNKKNLFKNLQAEVLDIAKKSINKRGVFKIVLNGGKSIVNLYKILSKSNLSFNKWHIYISDERLVPKNHKNRNDKLIYKIWLDSSRIPKKNINFIHSELGLKKARQSWINFLFRHHRQHHKGRSWTHSNQKNTPRFI